MGKQGKARRTKKHKDIRDIKEREREIINSLSVGEPLAFQKCYNLRMLLVKHTLTIDFDKLVSRADASQIGWAAFGQLF